MQPRKLFWPLLLLTVFHVTNSGNFSKSSTWPRLRRFCLPANLPGSEKKEVRDEEVEVAGVTAEAGLLLFSEGVLELAEGSDDDEELCDPGESSRLMAAGRYDA